MNLFLKIFAVVFTIIAVTGPVGAQQSSTMPFSLPAETETVKGLEVTYSHSTVRLLPGEFSAGRWTVGVGIWMAPGWKTYWRVPGDAGVPSEFTWESSINVKSVEVSWPAPNRYDDITGKSTGYKKLVVFPVEVTPVDPDQPAVLELQLFYGICSDICIPVTAELVAELPVDIKDRDAMDLINEFAATVPSPDAKGVTVNQIKAVSVDGKPVLAVTLSGKVDAKTDILVEGFDEAFFEAPKLAGNENGRQVFHLLIDGVENAAELTGKNLKLTVLSGEIRLEANVKVN